MGPGVRRTIPYWDGRAVLGARCCEYGACSDAELLGISRGLRVEHNRWFVGGRLIHCRMLSENGVDDIGALLFGSVRERVPCRGPLVETHLVSRR